MTKSGDFQHHQNPAADANAALWIVIMMGSHHDGHQGQI